MRFPRRRAAPDRTRRRADTHGRISGVEQSTPSPSRRWRHAPETRLSTLVLLLHGIGATGRDLAPLAGPLGARLSDAVFSAPDAPFPFDGGGPGRQWFSIDGITAENRPARVGAARAAFDTTVESALDAAGMDVRRDRVVFVGFSQGTIMLLDAVASGRWRAAAAVGFSGRLACPGPLAPPPGMPILLVHGLADPVVPPDETTGAEARLAAHGAAVRTLLEPGLGHGISRSGIAAAADFLATILQPQG